MKKFSFMLMLLLGITTQAQSIDFSGGYVPNGFGTSINYNHYLESGYNYIQIGFDTSFADAVNQESSIPYSDLILRGGYFFPLLQNENTTFQFAGGGGLLAGYETVNKDQENLLPNGSHITSKSDIVYGGFVSGELNLLLSENFFALIKYNHYYYLNSSLNPLSFYTGVGLRYYVGD